MPNTFCRYKCCKRARLRSSTLRSRPTLGFPIACTRAGRPHVLRGNARVLACSLARRAMDLAIREAEGGDRPLHRGARESSDRARRTRGAHASSVGDQRRPRRAPGRDDAQVLRRAVVHQRLQTALDPAQRIACATDRPARHLVRARDHRARVPRRRQRRSSDGGHRHHRVGPGVAGALVPVRQAHLLRERLRAREPGARCAA